MLVLRQPSDNYSFTGELVCSACGIVLKGRVETLTPEWRSLSPADDRARDGFPSSLLIHDTGLSIYIGAAWSMQPQEQSGSEQEAIILLLRTTMTLFIFFFLHPQGVMSDPGEQAAQAERKSVSGAPASRNLKKATWEMNRVCNGLWLSCQVAERSAYFYRKALQKGLIKGRSISGFAVAFIYLACKERMIT